MPALYHQISNENYPKGNCKVTLFASSSAHICQNINFIHICDTLTTGNSKEKSAYAHAYARTQAHSNLISVSTVKKNRE